MVKFLPLKSLSCTQLPSEQGCRIILLNTTWCGIFPSRVRSLRAAKLDFVIFCLEVLLCSSYVLLVILLHTCPSQFGHVTPAPGVSRKSTCIPSMGKPLCLERQHVAQCGFHTDQISFRYLSSKNLFSWLCQMGCVLVFFAIPAKPLHSLFMISS